MARLFVATDLERAARLAVTQGGDPEVAVAHAVSVVSATTEQVYRTQEIADAVREAAARLGHAADPLVQTIVAYLEGGPIPHGAPPARRPG